MAAYVVFIREGEVTDLDALKKYQDAPRSGPPPVGMKPLTLYGSMETIEGEPADGIVILEFPDMAAAKEWYYGEDYQARAKFRMQAAPYRGFIVEGM